MNRLATCSLALCALFLSQIALAQTPTQSEDAAILAPDYSTFD